MSKDHTWEYQNTVANIAMQYFGMRNATNIIANELTDSYYTPIAVNMAKSKYLRSKNHHNFLKDYWITKEMDTQRHFIQKIRQYNNMFAFTSMGGNIDKSINKGEGERS